MNPVYQLTIASHDTNSGNYISNVLHYRVGEIGGSSPWVYANALINAWQGHNETLWLACIAGTTIVDYYSCKKVNSGGGPSAIKARAMLGTQAGDALSSGVAADLAFITGIGSNRPGHVFVAPAPAGGIDGDDIIDPWLTPLLALGPGLLGSLTLSGGAGTADFTQYHRKTKLDDLYLHYDLRAKLTMLNKRTLPLI